MRSRLSRRAKDVFNELMITSKAPPPHINQSAEKRPLFPGRGARLLAALPFSATSLERGFPAFFFCSHQGRHALIKGGAVGTKILVGFPTASPLLPHLVIPHGKGGGGATASRGQLICRKGQASVKCGALPGLARSARTHAHTLTRTQSGSACSVGPSNAAADPLACRKQTGKWIRGNVQQTGHGRHERGSRRPGTN